MTGDVSRNMLHGISFTEYASRNIAEYASRKMLHRICFTECASLTMQHGIHRICPRCACPQGDVGDYIGHNALPLHLLIRIDIDVDIDIVFDVEVDIDVDVETDNDIDVDIDM